MAIKLYIPVLIFLSGMITYAAIHHYTIDQRPGERRVHLLFAGISLVIVLFILSSVQIFQAPTVNDLIQANRLNIAMYALFLALFPWFCAEYAGVRPRAVLAGLTGLATTLFLVNFIQPYTLLYKEIHGLGHLTLPWGEELVSPLATSSTWFYIAVLAIFLDIVFGFYALIVRFRSDRRRTALFMMLALGLFAAGTIPGILFRLGIVYLPPLGPLGYMSMIIVMGLTLNYEIQENRAHMRAILDHVPAHIFMKDPEGQYIMINRHFEELFHVSNEKMYGKTDHVLFPKEQADAMHADEQFVLTTRHPLECEDVLATNGEPRTYFSIKFPLFHADGTPFAVCSISTDITKRKLSELALKQSEAKYRRLYNETPILLHSIDRKERVIDVNDYWLKTMGYERSEVIGRKVTDFYTEASRKYAQEVTIPSFFRDGSVHNIPYQFVKKNGDLVDVLVSATAERDDAGNIVRSQSVIEDITERKRAEALLQESERKYRELVENANSIILRWGKDGRITFMNEFGLNFFGFSEKELVGHHWLDTIVPATESTGRDLSTLIEQIRTNPTAFEQNINENIRRSGERVWISWRNKPVLDEQGRLVEVFSIGSDITERKLAEGALHESEIKFRAIFENSRDAIGIAKKGMHYYANPAYLKLFGFERNEEIVGTSLLNHIAPSHHQQMIENLRRRAAGEAIPSFYTTRGRKTDGTEFPMEISASTFELQGETYTVANIRDITEQLRAEEEKAKLENQLRQAQKMEAIGQLAGGVAHDFNNLLTIFGTYGGILGDKLKNDDVLRPYAERIVEATEKAAGLTQSLLAFSRKQTISLKSIDLNEIIRKVDHFLHRIIGEDIELKSSIAGTELTVMADSGQIEQVLMNLATNARDAMPQGGLLAINSEATRFSDADVKFGEIERAGMYARISVSDTGHGMDKATLEKIFEPFFTTKEVGKGTGLGLAIVYGIIKQHGGTIRVYSEPGQGTTFKIYLPLLQSATEKLEDVLLPPPRGGNETILFVEDNATVRESIKVILEEAGYNVIEAADGEDALAEFNRHRDKIMLLLSDVIMPKMNGKEVYDAIRGIRQDIKALFISGYTADIITSKGLLDEGLHLMYKPPDPDALKRKIREILDSKQGDYE
jgi:two-component system, NtrC family, sensor kinase